MQHTKRRELNRDVESRRLSLCFSDICSLFAEPITMAATELGISESHLKRQCRKMGIKRWPQRKLKSLNERLQKLQELSQTTETIEKTAFIQAKIDELYRSPSRTHKLKQHELYPSVKCSKIEETKMTSCVVTENEEVVVEKELSSS